MLVMAFVLSVAEPPTIVASDCGLGMVAPGLVVRVGASLLHERRITLVASRLPTICGSPLANRLRFA
jgi:hypothetical protein